MRSISPTIFVGIGVGILVMLSVFWVQAVSPLIIVLVAAGAVLWAVPLDVGFFLVVALFFVNPPLLPVLFEIGEFTIRIVDIGFAVLVLRVVFGSIVGKHTLRVPKTLLPVAVLVAFIGVSVLIVPLSVPEFLAASVASYVRLVETMLCLPLAYACLRRESQIVRFIALICFASAANVAVVLWRLVADPITLDSVLLTVRLEGLLGSNSVGLVSGMLILAAVAWRRQARVMWTGIMIGVTGLLLVKSASSIIAAASGLMVAYFHGRRIATRTLARHVGVLVLTALVVGGGLWVFRRADIEALRDLSGGSFAQRLYFASLGITLFLRHPLLGVGWQASSTASVIQDPEVNAAMLSQFPRLPYDYFTVNLQTTSLHNMYIQMLVETGLLGALVLLGTIIWLIGHIRRLLRQAAPVKALGRAVEFFAASLVLLLVWWNTNPLYPGQIESVLAMTFLGAIPAAARAARANAQDEPEGHSVGGSIGSV